MDKPLMQEWTPETVRNLLRALEGYPEQEQYQVVAAAHNAALALERNQRAPTQVEFSPAGPSPSSAPARAV